MSLVSMQHNKKKKKTSWTVKRNLKWNILTVVVLRAACLWEFVCVSLCAPVMSGICRSIGFHCTWPVGFIIITHFNEVASDGTTRSLRLMFRWESAKTATRWFRREWLEYQTGFTNRIIFPVMLGSLISAMFTKTDSQSSRLEPNVGEQNG